MGREKRTVKRIQVIVYAASVENFKYLDSVKRHTYIEYLINETSQTVILQA